MLEIESAQLSLVRCASATHVFGCCHTQLRSFQVEAAQDAATLVHALRCQAVASDSQAQGLADASVEQDS